MDNIFLGSPQPQRNVPRTPFRPEAKRKLFDGVENRTPNRVARDLFAKEAEPSSSSSPESPPLNQWDWSSVPPDELSQTVSDVREAFFSPPRKRREVDETYRPLHRPSFNADGSLKGPCRYKTVSDIKNLRLFLKNAMDVQKDSHFRWYGKQIHFEIQHDPNARGQFNIFARIARNQPEIIQGIPNERIGLKTFRDHCIMVQSGPDKVHSESHMNVLDQFWALKDLGIPVAEIFNPVEAEHGCGFFLVEVVPYPFFADWAKGVSLDDLSNQQFDFLLELQWIFQKSYDARIIPDLKPDNLRVRENGQLTITDLREVAISGEEQDELDCNFKAMLRSFNCEEGDAIYEFLSPF